MVSSMDLVLFFYNYLPTKKFLSILAFKCYDGIVQEDGPEVIKSLEEKTCGVTIVDCIKYSGYINRSEYFVTFYYVHIFWVEKQTTVYFCCIESQNRALLGKSMIHGETEEKSPYI